MSTTLIKNEDGSYSYGEFAVLAPVYDRSTKKHIFNILRNGFVPIRHDGNFLTLKNAIKNLTDNAVGEQPVINIEAGPIRLTQPMRIVCENTGWHGLKDDETVTTEGLLAEATPVFYGPDLISNEEIEFPSLIEEQEHTDSPLMTALKASLEASQRDLLSEEADEKYWVFKNLLDQDLETTRRELEQMEVAVAE